MTRKSNKGEWSEFYAFLKILDERKLFAADKNLEIIDGKFFVFHKIIREEADETTKLYDISRSETSVIITDEDGRILKEFDATSLKEKTIKYLNASRMKKRGHLQYRKLKNSWQNCSALK